MATNNKLSELTISYVKRNARAKGPTSSEAWNDNADELARDLANLYNEWNNSLIPLLRLLPHSDLNYNIDAYSDGLDGRTLLVNYESSETDALKYWNGGAGRPNSVYEQFQDIYSFIDTKVNTVQEQIDTVSLAAGDIAIIDNGNVFSSGTVEEALQEVMNLVAKTGTDHGVLTGLSDDDHTQYLPRTGSRSMTGALNMSNNNISSVATITGTLAVITTVSAGTVNAATVLNAITSLVVGPSGAKLVPSGLSTSMILNNNGGTQNAGLFQGANVQLQTTPTSASATLCNTIYQNTGDTSLTTITLPTAVAGLQYGFCVLDSDGLKVQAAAGDTIRIGTSVSAAAGFCQATALGATVFLVAMDDTQWVAMYSVGSWTVT